MSSVKALISIIPLALVMVTGPQILTSILIATQSKWKKQASLFLIGSTLGMATVISVAYFTGFSLGKNSNGNGILKAIIVCLLAYLIVTTYLNRNVKKQSKILDKLQNLNDKTVFAAGLFLMSIFPTDLITNLSVGSTLAYRDKPLWLSLVFIFVTLILLGLPFIFRLVFPKKADSLISQLKQYMKDYAWVINEIILILILVMTLT